MMGRSAVVVLAVLVWALVLGAFPAFANVTVSTTDGVSLVLTDAGAFSSLTVDGHAAPTLSGVPGVFIIPMDGQTMDVSRQTYYAGNPGYRHGHPERQRRVVAPILDVGLLAADDRRELVPVSGYG